MNCFLSKPIAVTSCVHERMLCLSVIALVLIASRPTQSAQPDDTQTLEVLAPSAPIKLSPPLPAQPEEDITWQQEPTSPLPSSMPPQLHDTDRVTDEIVELMDQLKSPQHDLQRMGDRDSAMADLHAEVTRNSIDHSLQLQRIQNRISVLRSLLQQGNNCQETEPQDSNASSNKPTTPDPVPALPASSPLQDSVGDPPDDPRSMASAFIVTEHAVDRLSLANNLFAAGQIDLALPIYAELLTLEPAPNDRVWIEYQLANCYRRSGDIKRAEKLYRVVAGSTASLYWAERARWWMSNLAKVQGFLNRQAQLADALDQIQKRFDETISP